MIRFTKVADFLIVELTDQEKLLKEYPDLDVELRELMEQSNFAPEGTKESEWDDISYTIGSPAIGYKIYDEGGCLAHAEDFDFQMYEYKGADNKNYLRELVEREQLLFTPFEFTQVPPKGF